MDYIVISQKDGKPYYWMGRYGWTDGHPGLSYMYKRWQDADKACKRMARKWRGVLAQNAKFCQYDELFTQTGELDVNFILTGEKNG